MTIPKRHLNRYKSWVLTAGYSIDTTTLMWFYNQQGKAYRSNGDIIISVGKEDYRLEDVASQFIEGARA